jgi:c-di-GMP-binding flagellar brake protein YcgR
MPKVFESVLNAVATGPSLAVGQRIQLGVTSAAGPRWYASRVEEQDASSERLVVAWPTAQMSLIAVHPGQTVLVAVSASDALYSASAVIERTDQQDPAYLALGPSGPWRRAQRREDVRLDIVIKTMETAVQRKDDWVELKGIIRNLSAGGVLVQSPIEIHTGERLRLSFILPIDGRELNVMAEARRIRRRPLGTLDLWEVGSKFTNLKTTDRERVVRCIFEQQRQFARRDKGL